MRYMKQPSTVVRIHAFLGIKIVCEWSSLRKKLKRIIYQFVLPKHNLQKCANIHVRVCTSEYELMSVKMRAVHMRACSSVKSECARVCLWCALRNECVHK